MKWCERSCKKKCTCKCTRNVKWKSYFLVWKLWLRLRFLKSRSNIKVKVTRSKIMEWRERSCHKKCTITNMKALAFLIWKIWPRLKFLKSKSNFEVKVTGKKYGMMWKVFSQGLHNHVKYESPIFCCSLVMTKVKAKFVYCNYKYTSLVWLIVSWV